MRDSEGIPWIAGDEDYPFAVRPGEDARAYTHRWLADAPYARVVRDTVRYIHETDVANLVNAVTSDPELMQAGLSEWGDRLLRSHERTRLIEMLKAAAAAATRVADVLASDAPSDDTEAAAD